MRWFWVTLPLGESFAPVNDNWHLLFIWLEQQWLISEVILPMVADWMVKKGDSRVRLDTFCPWGCGFNSCICSRLCWYVQDTSIQRCPVTLGILAPELTHTATFLCQVTKFSEKIEELNHDYPAPSSSQAHTQLTHVLTTQSCLVLYRHIFCVAWA